jgi:hypothetical protein
MSTTTTNPRPRKARPKPERRIRLRHRPLGSIPGILEITIGKETTGYFLTELAADYGRGFLVEKIGADGEEGKYQVNIDGARESCCCMGFDRWGHCKHCDGLAALIAAGRL